MKRTTLLNMVTIIIVLVLVGLPLESLTTAEASVIGEVNCDMRQLADLSALCMATISRARLG